MNKVTIYTIKGCPYCRRAKQLLSDRNIPFTEHVYKFNTPQMDELISRTRHDTVPQIFIGSKFIGGCDELEVLINANRLQTYLGN